jgi:phospholipid/cholesterol/gamma-HCH transport system permease protein
MVGALGRWAISRTRDFSYAMGFFFQVLTETALFVRRRQVAFRVLVLQILFTGVEALSIVSLVALSIGAVIIVEGGTILPRFGQSSLMYSILIIVITRELGPLLTAFIVIARSGTAIATELGNMVVSHEIEAYLSVGINPIAYLVVPRVLGVTISLMALTIYFNVFGLIGSFLVSQFVKPVPFGEYFRALLSAMQLADILSTLRHHRLGRRDLPGFQGQPLGDGDPPGRDQGRRPGVRAVLHRGRPDHTDLLCLIYHPGRRHHLGLRCHPAPGPP